MLRLLTKPMIPALVLGLTAFGWTASDEPVSTAGLDAELQAEPGCASAAACDTAFAGFSMRWVSRTRAGNLFLVVRSDCGVTDCGAWFVERTARGVGMRLNVDGRFRVVSGPGAIPDVETWKELSDSEVEYTRYSWVAGTYVRADSRTVYRVDGVECGTALQCYETARAAYQHDKAEKALNIWEKVHKVSWI